MAFTFFGTVVVVCGICFLIACTRRGTVASISIGSRVQTFTTTQEPDRVFDAIVGGVSPFKHEDSDKAARAILLGTNPTFATWGFFYPIRIETQPGGGSIVYIGIRSKVIQWGPLVTRWHLKCRDAVAGLVNAELPSARVVG